MRVLIYVLVLAACSTDDGAAPPAAPTNLAVTNLTGGGHLTWTDNSDNEDQFIIMRRPAAGATFDDIDMVPFNRTQYHDASVAPGMTYVYKIAAINAAGETTSNEVMFAP